MEFAIILPAILATIALVIAGIVLAGTRLSLVTAAHDIARLEARGDSHLAATRLEQAPNGTTMTITHEGALTCVVLTATPGAGILKSLTLAARGCAVRHVDTLGMSRTPDSRIQ